MAHIDTIKRTKILATLGPSVDDKAVLEKIIRCGVNACRLNFSHGDEAQRLMQINNIREISHRLGRHIAIVQDLQGPKIRFGMLKDNARFDIHEGETYGLTYGIEHDGGNNLPSQYDLSDKCEVGDNIFLFDGKIRAVVQSIEGKTVWVKAMNSGYIMSRKAINLPDMKGGKAPVLTEKDLADLEWGLTQDIDYTAISFIHHADDVRKLKDIIKSKGSDRPVIVKLETRAGADPANLEDIVREADGMMVARGDLAVEAGYEIVPVVERQILQLCQKYNKLCIVATQMLGSMVEQPEPTRAEVNDVATAAMLGADATMLSDESAAGKYPVEAVTVMDTTSRYTQAHPEFYTPYERHSFNPEIEAVAKSAVEMAQGVRAKAIVTEDSDMSLARALANQKANFVNIAMLPTERLANRASLLSFTRSFVVELGHGEEKLHELGERDFFGGDYTVVYVSHTDNDAYNMKVISR